MLSSPTVCKILPENPTNSVTPYISMNMNELVGICLKVLLFVKYC